MHESFAKYNDLNLNSGCFLSLLYDVTPDWLICC